MCRNDTHTHTPANVQTSKICDTAIEVARCYGLDFGRKKYELRFVFK